LLIIFAVEKKDGETDKAKSVGGANESDEEKDSYDDAATA